VNRTVLIQNQ